MQDVSCWLKISVYFRILDLFFLSSFPKIKSGISCWEQSTYWIGHCFSVPADLCSRNPAIQKADEAVLHRWEGLKVLQAFLSNSRHLVLLVHLLNPLCKYRCEFLTAVGLCSIVAGPTSSALCVEGQKVCGDFFVSTAHKAEGRTSRINASIIKGFFSRDGKCRFRHDFCINQTWVYFRKAIMFIRGGKRNYREVFSCSEMEL